MADHPKFEPYIPIRRAELIDLLCRTPGVSPQEAADFRQLCRLLEATLQYEYHQRLGEIRNHYACFDPDVDTRCLAETTPAEKDKRLEEFVNGFVWMLDRAGFRRLSRDDIIRAVRDPSDWGLDLDVDFSIFDRLEVFARGDTLQRRKRRRVRSLMRQEKVDVPMYQRLVVLIRLRPHKKLAAGVNTNSVYLKLFKEIPKVDLEMLLPGSRARMHWVDRLKFSASTLTGLGMTGFKITTSLLGPISTFGLVTLAGGAITYGVRSLYGYWQTKQKYQLTLAESLYFQNLDNNSGVLCRLLTEAEEQDFREAAVAYFFLWRATPEVGWGLTELGAEIEHFLERGAGIRVRFEVEDALQKLRRLKLVDETADGTLRAVPIADALVNLDWAWDNYFKYNRWGAAPPPETAEERLAGWDVGSDKGVL